MKMLKRLTKLALDFCKIIWYAIHWKLRTKLWLLLLLRMLLLRDKHPPFAFPDGWVVGKRLSCSLRFRSGSRAACGLTWCWVALSFWWFLACFGPSDIQTRSRGGSKLTSHGSSSEHQQKPWGMCNKKDTTPSVNMNFVRPQEAPLLGVFLFILNLFLVYFCLFSC